MKADADLLSASFNATIAKWLTEWNFPGAAPPITLIHRGTPQPLELDYARLQEEVASRTLLAITDAEAALLHPAITDSEPPSSTR